jgi:flavin reductase (DIM6/NTAB) family NADH-FMN oxidoreductase RutF
MSSKRAPEGKDSIDASLYRRTCARFATGITVVTVADATGKPHGMTVNSFSSVSLAPPLVLVSIDLRTAILSHFLSSPYFAINILAENQEHLSKKFSRSGSNRFHGVAWRAGGCGVPLLDGALAQLECSLTRTFEAGDHSVLIGEVRNASYNEGRPLVYFNSSYRSLGSPE